ncbi:hypothetical protein CBM2589_B220131 [Cupriavidus taiwanensis]|uniref:Uncharacterized protein n=1 Tax=Cupriavidus taiwanensis TaxID=164546 RepID=A0A975WYX0_9BURK|nr:hypothetical protein CBM2589_B220131 [Cupriavidus taiwanensis]
MPEIPLPDNRRRAGPGSRKSGSMATNPAPANRTVCADPDRHDRPRLACAPCQPAFAGPRLL